jgi:hypothetical protein
MSVAVSLSYCGETVSGCPLQNLRRELTLVHRPKNPSRSLNLVSMCARIALAVLETNLCVSRLFLL